MFTDSAPSNRFGRDTAVRELLRPLEPFFALKDVTEIVVNRPCEVLYEQGAEWRSVHVPELPFPRLMSLVRAIATFTDQDVGPKKPILSAILPDGQRIQIMAPPAVPPDTLSLSIRLPGQAIRSLQDYQAEGAFDRFVWAAPTDPPRLAGDLDRVDMALMDTLRSRDLGAFFTAAVENRRNIAVVGDTGSGKTTLMKTLCQHIPARERIITIEDVREVFLPTHENLVHLLYSKGGQGVAEVSPADLIAACMRMRPDRVLLAELRGSEAFDFLKLLTTGHSGSITSYHAESCALALERYVLMAKEHADAAIFDADGLKRLVRLTLDIIVHVRAEIVSDPGGETRKRRFVSEIHFDPVGRRRDRFEDYVVMRGAA
ncbi:MAG: P-type DNA transfer ATPase VirB11 [Asticcacaulis sp.]|uniref:P-type DNA transfer ATPase VirB11 n=1 Tax=Asticcacaulis sp. TaxID=1872648 RepID=UPI003F7CD2BD